jgi:hypothetical protein
MINNCLSNKLLIKTEEEKKYNVNAFFILILNVRDSDYRIGSDGRSQLDSRSFTGIDNRRFIFLKNVNVM